MAVYTPQHRKVKRGVFNYERERDGPRRPRNVLIFDRCFQVVFLVYAILGVLWVDEAETCQETAPHLYSSTIR